MYSIYHSFMNVHLKFFLLMFSVKFTHERGRLFHSEGADLTCSMLFVLKGLLKCICKFISMICLIYQIMKEGGFCREKLDLRVKRELRMCVSVCVVGRVCSDYILQTTSTYEKGLEPYSSSNWYNNSASHCVKGRSSLKTLLNQLWVLTLGQNEYKKFLVICLSVHHVMSLSVYFAIHILSRSG